MKQHRPLTPLIDESEVGRCEMDDAWHGGVCACQAVNGRREGESPLRESSGKDKSTVPSSTAHLILLSTTNATLIHNSQCFCV